MGDPFGYRSIQHLLVDLVFRHAPITGGGLDVDTKTGEIIEPEQAPDPYADTELMYKIYLLLDQKVEIVK